MPKDQRTKQNKSPVCPYPVVGLLPRTTDWTLDDQSTEGETESVSMATTSESPPDGGCRDNETNLIVNYLPSTMTQDDIRSLFCSLGELESCKLIRDKVSGQSLGYGFVKYKRAGDARRAIGALNGLRLQNKTIKVDKTIQVSLARPSSDTIKGANLYISGLSKTMTSHDLHKLFCSYGDIITARVLSDTLTGFSKGVGFIRYNLKSQAEAAIRDLNGSIPTGSREPITVKFANQPTANKPVVIFPQPQLTTAICPQSGQIIGAYPSISPAASINRICYPPQQEPPPPPTALPLTAATPSSGSSIYIANLPADIDDTSLYRLLSQFGSVQSIHLLRHPTTNKARGSALVTMATYEEALLAAASLAYHQLDGQPIQASIILQKATPTACVLPAGLLPPGHGAGYGLLPSSAAGTAHSGLVDPLEMLRLGGGGGLQFVGYQGYRGLPPGAVAMATVGDCGGLIM